ncbi:MAG: diacylglycerol kinase, partial [Opitutales bacterium]
MPLQTPEETLANPHKRVGFRRVLRATGYSLEGMGSALKHESAFRQELVLACFLVPLALFMPIGQTATFMLVSSVFLVLIVELMNSAVEWVVDYISLDLHP